jgi:hypothetical protein
MRHLSIVRAAALSLLLPLGSCVSGEQSVAPDDSPWLKPSPILQQQIDAEAQRLPWCRGVELMEKIHWFGTVGEPAYEVLLELAASDSDQVASAALAALSISSDSRLVPYIREAVVIGPETTEVIRLERARTLVSLGDWSELPVLVKGLRSENAITRTLCRDALLEATNQTFDFDPRGDEQERERAVQAWERWWLKRGGDPFLNEPTRSTTTPTPTETTTEG